MPVFGSGRQIPPASRQQSPVAFRRSSRQLVAGGQFFGQAFLNLSRQMLPVIVCRFCRQRRCCRSACQRCCLELSLAFSRDHNANDVGQLNSSRGAKKSASFFWASDFVLPVAPVEPDRQQAPVEQARPQASRQQAPVEQAIFESHR